MPASKSDGVSLPGNPGLHQSDGIMSRMPQPEGPSEATFDTSVASNSFPWTHASTLTKEGHMPNTGDHFSESTCISPPSLGASYPAGKAVAPCSDAISSWNHGHAHCRCSMDSSIHRSSAELLHRGASAFLSRASDQARKRGGTGAFLSLELPSTTALPVDDVRELFHARYVQVQSTT